MAERVERAGERSHVESVGRTTCHDVVWDKSRLWSELEKGFFMGCSQ